MGRRKRFGINAGVSKVFQNLKMSHRDTEAQREKTNQDVIRLFNSSLLPIVRLSLCLCVSVADSETGFCFLSSIAETFSEDFSTVLVEKPVENSPFEVTSS
jgi:hypothetical protein